METTEDLTTTYENTSSQTSTLKRKADTEIDRDEMVVDDQHSSHHTGSDRKIVQTRKKRKIDTSLVFRFLSETTSSNNNDAADVSKNAMVGESDPLFEAIKSAFSDIKQHNKLPCYGPIMLRIKSFDEIDVKFDASVYFIFNRCLGTTIGSYKPNASGQVNNEDLPCFLVSIFFDAEFLIPKSEDTHKGLNIQLCKVRYDENEEIKKMLHIEDLDYSKIAINNEYFYIDNYTRDFFFANSSTTANDCFFKCEPLFLDFGESFEQSKEPLPTQPVVVKAEKEEDEQIPTHAYYGKIMGIVVKNYLQRNTLDPAEQSAYKNLVESYRKGCLELRKKFEDRVLKSLVSSTNEFHQNLQKAYNQLKTSPSNTNEKVDMDSNVKQQAPSEMKD